MLPRIGIAGINGRMGHCLTAEILSVGATLAGGTARVAGEADFADITALAAACDVVIDFTHASTVAANAAALAAAETAWVLGTTGYGPEDEAAIAAAAARIPVVAAANFSAGVTLVLALAERLAAALPAATYDAEIIEMHHRQKVDAPSGTALAIARAVAAGRGVALEDVMAIGRHGQTGTRRDGEIGIASLRGGQIVGSHNLTFTAATEQIGLTHHAFDRRVFAAGAVRAALWVRGRAAGLYNMKDVLGL
jgi:4-hydroxy-tetrahydrodipicolinate reductase